MSKNDPAFPAVPWMTGEGKATIPIGRYGGLTKRQWMIGQVAAGMGGLLGHVKAAPSEAQVDNFVSWIVVVADKLLEQERTRDAAESS